MCANTHYCLGTLQGRCSFNFVSLSLNIRYLNFLLRFIFLSYLNHYFNLQVCLSWSSFLRHTSAFHFVTVLSEVKPSYRYNNYSHISLTTPKHLCSLAHLLRRQQRGGYFLLQFWMYVKAT